MTSRDEWAAERRRLLRECPSQAASWDEEERDPSAYISMPDAPVEAMQEYLDTLPDNETGTLWVDEYRNLIVVQVTERADRDAVQAVLQRLAAGEVTVDIEVVRYSAKDLEVIADRIAELPALELIGIGISGVGGCVEVTVPGGVDAARSLIATIADPCSYRVVEGTWTHGG